MRLKPHSILCVVLAFALAAPAVFAKAREFRVEEATIADIQQAILAKQLTSTELVKLYLTRIKAYNGQSVEMPQGLLGPIKTIPHAGQLNALSTLNLRPAARKAWGFDDHHSRSNTDAKDDDSAMPDALEVAAQQDEYFAKTGKLIGPLHGVVMAIKDQYDTFDLRTTSGADVDWANDRPPRDGEFVVRLRKAGAIILAKSNLGEYASGIPRSSWGGVFSNPYDTERSPMGSSSGSGIAVAANLVTCAIGEETGTSIRGPSCFNNLVGIAGTQELVPRDGMIGAGTNTRCGPICRTVEDAARILSVIAGYSPKDEYTAFSIGRLPDKPYQEFAHEKSLKGLRIGVVREYMDKHLFTKADEENIDLINAAIEDLKKLGAEIVDPGEAGLFTPYVRRYFPMLSNATFAKRFKDLFPVDAAGKPTTDQIATLVDLAVDPTKAPANLTIRDLGQVQAAGESAFMMQLYVSRRGDANIKTLDDLATKARFFEGKDQFFGDRKATVQNWAKTKALDTAARMQHRFAVQQVILAAMADLKLDACVYPTNNLPSHILGGPTEPTKNGRPEVWSFFGGQGFPTMTVPAGFTTHVYDRVEDPNGEPPPPVEEGRGGPGEGVKRVATRLVGPTPAKLPVGLDIMSRPFSEPIMLRIASAYEARTHHRLPPPDFGPVTAGSASQ
jgi:Asp-tRNA(Asn)/Glu-tRNA(Gln) amidotransferase A subunit family amidase